MGEIADALRRAREDRSEPPDRPRGATPERKASEDVYSSSAALHEQEHAAKDAPDEPDPGPVAEEPRAPSPPAPAPAARPAASTRPAAPAEASKTGVQLTHLGNESHAAQGVIIDDGGAVTDACLQLALRVCKALRDRDARTLAVVSAQRNEGKTTVSCNLALALASIGQAGRVALVDLDLRRPSLATVLELSTPKRGIEDVLSGEASLEQVRIAVASPRLDVYPCLRGHPKAHEMLLAPDFEAMVRDLADRYDVVVFDSPPTLLVPDSTIIMQHVDCFAPVARAGMTRSRNFRKMLETLPRRRMLGAILDEGTRRSQKGYYDHYAVDVVVDPEADVHGDLEAPSAAPAGPDEERAHGG